jgi:subtilisin family serine protease
MKSKVFRFLVLLVVLAMVAAPASARSVQPSPESGEPVFEPAEATRVSTPKVSREVLNEDKDASGPALYTVLLREAPLASYDGSISGMPATSPRLTGAAKLDAKSPESQAYRTYLASQQDAFVAELEAQFGRSIEVQYKYQVALNGFAAVLTPEEAAAIAQRSDVRLVERNGFAETTTDVGPAWIGAPGIWDGTNTGGLPGTQGEGVIVGILDTGINSDHSSFAEVGPVDAYVHVNPFGAGTYVGVCDPGDPSYDPSFVCNDKLIGAWEYAYDLLPPTGYTDYPSPEDENGHGSHTASTTAGNALNATMVAPTLNFTRDISGVAPHANIIAYDVCYHNNATGGGSCAFVATTAATEQAILDGVDVINFSIGGGEDPYGETTELAFLEAYNAGVFVSTSAGNEGPGADTVGHRGPWVSASAAATHNRTLFNSLVDMAGDGTPPADMTGKGFTSGFGPAEIVYAGDYGDPLCPIGAFPAGTFSGEIVVCDRGIHARVDKAQSVADGGAGGFVLANDAASGASLVGDAYAVPGVHITYDDGVVLKAWIADGTTHTASISGVVEDLSATNADILADFSSRGPNTTFDVLKPNLTAPGVDIWAAVQTPDPDNPTVDEFEFYSGTSMAAPHTAGAAALMTALYPAWSSNAILSAMMMTADLSVLREDGATDADWFDMGAGRVDLNLAAETGLVLDETYANFVAADPALGGDVKTLNTPSLTDSQCLQNCDWTRTFTSVAAADVEWTVSSSGDFVTSSSPITFTVAAGATQAVTFTADVTGLPSGDWLFGMVTLTPDDPAIPTLNIPVSVVPTSGVFPTLVTINTRRDVGSQMIEGVESIEVTELTTEIFGLAKGELTTASVPVDPTNGDAYDDPSDGGFVVLADVPAGAVRMVAEITSTTAADVDLFVGLDANGDGMPSEDELVCTSATPLAFERCDIMEPDAGSYWVLVQNWAASALGAIDDITLSVGVVTGDAGNMVVEGPETAAELTPYDLTVYYDISESMAGDVWYGAFTFGSSAATPGDIGTIAVDVVRFSDDVVKTAPAVALPGETVTYEVMVDTNVTPEDLTYTIIDTIPAGLELDPSSINVSVGSYAVVGNTIIWTVTMQVPYYDYTMTTSADDPMCDTGFGGYVDLEEFGILAQSAVTGDTTAFTAFSTGDPFNYFGKSYTGVGFTDDGFAIFDVPNNFAGMPWFAQSVPDPEYPNNLLGMLWQDMEFIYDAPTNRGVSLATAGADVVVIEYDDMQLYQDPSNQYDFEIVATRSVNDTPGWYEYVFAYDNLDGDLAGPLTVGLENDMGTLGTALVNNGDATGVLSNGFQVCFDQVTVGSQAVMTYDVTVTAALGETIPNSVISGVDNPGSEATTATANLFVGLGTYLPEVMYLSDN